MTQKKLAKILTDNEIGFRVRWGWIHVNGDSVYLGSLTTLPEGVKFENGGSVDLGSLTTLPEGVKFENGGSVYLRSLTTLPEGVKFENGGSVYLRSLTTLPEGVKFENGGSVDLRSLTTLPEGVKFENGGSVDLGSLTSLPENVKFENGGYVYLRSLTSLPENVKFENGGDVDLRSLTSLPENVKFENGGNVILKDKKEHIGISYLKRFKIPVTRGFAVLFKRVSKDWKTQEGTMNETRWRLRFPITVKTWEPSKGECGAGKFHACARPNWCSSFRQGRGDRFIAVKIAVKDLYEWTNSPQYPGKIGFRKGTVLYEVDRHGRKIKSKKK